MAITGPRPMSRESRLSLAQDILARAKSVHGADLLAAGLCGSVACGTDGPYSDLEMLCVLRRPGVDTSHEWSTGPWKAEVNFVSQDLVLAEAARVDGRWPLTHGAFLSVRPLYDPEGFFPRLKATVLAQPDTVFREAIRGAIVGELYEWIGKVRNAAAAGHTVPLPELAVKMAHYGAFVLGLAHRRCYSTGSRVLEEALSLPDRPVGFDELCRLAMAGDLADPARVASTCEAFWGGLDAWAAERGIRVYESRRIPF